MFKKKYTSKEAQTVGKSNVKALKADVLDIIGHDNGELFDLIVGKKDTVTKGKYQCGPGASAFAYFVNDVPFFISVDRLSDEEQTLISEDRGSRYPVIPTVFFFLRLHQLLADRKEQWRHLISEAGTTVTCFGPTSRFLLSGAHLMMPGILRAHANKPAAEGQVAFIFTNGVEIPYAIGFVTSNLISQKDSGVGVYVVQCFRDNLWQDHENRFLTNYSLSSQAALIPVAFGDSEVVGEAADVAKSDEPADISGETAEATENAPAEEEETVATSTLFEDEDSVLTFCLCETVRQMSRATLPMPLPQFTSVVVRSYPRDGAHAGSIQFKDTKYKRALPFFQKFPELLVIAETSPGVHSVMTVNKSAAVMREHKKKYSVFLETVQREACEHESRVLQAKLLESGTAVFRQNIVSAGVFYAASRDLDEDLVRILLLGEELNIPENVRFPTLEQVMSGTAPTYEPTPVDEGVFDELYTRKTLVDNLKKYILAHTLLVVSTAGKGEMPTVKINDVLSKMFTSKSYAPELALNQVEEGMLKLFRTKHEILLQTTVEGSTLASENLVPKRIIKAGMLPKVNVWAEKATGNKYVTIVRNLESFGFDLNLLSRQWKKQFSSSCSVVDPSTDMKNLKSGTKIPLEIHLQGNSAPKVEAALLNEANLPASALVSKKP